MSVVCGPSAPPERLVIVGSRGFIGRSILGACAAAGRPHLGLSSQDVDLAAPDGGAALAARLAPGDAVLFLSALTPDKGRGVDAFMANLRMGEALCAALAAQPVAHLTYFSSDAVYPLSLDEDERTTEASAAAPGDLYGAMHLARELMAKTVAGDRLLILRPTMAFGFGDTHNSYGPNRLRRMAAADRRIALFGEGEELRDHIWIDDLTRLTLALVDRRATGIVNGATGTSIRYADLARSIAARFGPDVAVAGAPRANAITHRRFDAAALRAALPDFAFTPLDSALDAVHAAHMADPERDAL